MGTLALCGTLYAVLALGTTVVGFSFINNASQTTLVTVLIVSVQIVLLTVTLSLLLPFCGRAARGESARLNTLWPGRSPIVYLGLILTIWLLVCTALLFNANLYLNLQNTIASPIFRMAVILIGALVGWALAGWLLFLPIVLCAATFGSRLTLKTVFSNALLALALSPLLWIFVGIFGVILLVSGGITRVGLILFLPVMASVSQTAYQISMQYASFLAEAKDTCGAGKSLKEYKDRATELAQLWEYRQPRRTFKEIIRPWEY